MRKSQIVVVLVALLIFAAIIGVAYKRRNYGGTTTPGVVGEQVNKIVEVDPFNPPEEFPPNFPIKEGSEVIDNYNATSPDGRVQATRVVRSPFTPMGAFSYYKDFLQAEGDAWEILGEVNTATNPNHKAIFAQNSRGMLSINISADSAPGFSVIDISYVIQP